VRGCSDHVGRWDAPPAYCGPGSNKLSGGNTDAPLLGNGDVGVNLCGGPSAPTFYVGKNDFWSTYNSDVTHNMYQSLASVARVQLDLRSLFGGADSESSAAAAAAAGGYELMQHLGNASVTSAFQAAGAGGARFTTRSIVVANSNVLLAELSSSQATNVTIRLTTGSATGTRRGLPVSAGRSTATSAGASSIYIARNSSSAAHVHPSAGVPCT